MTGEDPFALPVQTLKITPSGVYIFMPSGGIAQHEGPPQGDFIYTRQGDKPTSCIIKVADSKRRFASDFFVRFRSNTTQDEFELLLTLSLVATLPILLNKAFTSCPIIGLVKWLQCYNVEKKKKKSTRIPTM